MENHPFKNWYAISGCACWYIGYLITKEEAEAEAIKRLNVHHSNIGYCIVNKQVLESIYYSIKHALDINDKTDLVDK
jgi:hypothetical protein